MPMSKFVSTPFAVAGATLATAAFALAAVAPAGASAADNFQITSLTFDDDMAINVESTLGDDNGFIGIAGGNVLWTGDTAFGWMPGNTLGSVNTIAMDNVDPAEFLVSDLETETSYLFSYVQPDENTNTVSALNELDSEGVATGNIIELSEDITWNWQNYVDLDTDYPCANFGSGWGRVAIWDGCSGIVYDIDVATGEVNIITDALRYENAQPVVPDWWAEVSNEVNTGGVVENVDGELRFLLPSENVDGEIGGITRYYVTTPDVASEEVIAFGTEAPDVFAWNFSTSLNRWYLHVEGDMGALTPNATPVGSGEMIVGMNGTYAVNASEEEALAETGIEAGALAGAALLSILAGLVVAARRRARA